MTVIAGVVAVQGDVAEHAAAVRGAVEAAGRTVEVRSVREPGEVPACDLLAMPGGESTTISRLIHDEGIAPEIREHVAAGKPLLATCAGLIVASRDANDDRVETLGLVDATVERNAFGRQAESFEAPLSIDGIEGPYPGVFIRAPVVESVGEATVLSRWNGSPVAIRDGPVFGTAFHPELTGDDRVHRLAFGLGEGDGSDR